MASDNKENEVENDGFLFLNGRGYSMHFIICHRDSERKKELKNTIEYHLGTVSFDLTDLSPYTAILTDNPSLQHEKAEIFKIEYIRDCLQSKRILDINKYQWSKSNKYIPSFEYMDIIFRRRYGWNSIPSQFFITTEEENNCDDVSDDDFLAYNNIYNNKSCDTNKRTRQPYSRSEKEAIIHYIVSRRLYDKVRGVEMWKDLEASNICPIRTWQSLKEHTLKTLAKEINTFKIFSEQEKEKLNKALNPLKRKR